jgi:hypothetical protein
MMKGKGIALLLGEKPEEEESEMGEDEESSDEESQTMQLAAMKKFMGEGSPESKLKALKQLIKLCGDY